MSFRGIISRLSSWRYLHTITLIFIVVLGGFLRAYRLGYKPLWFDEAVTYWASQIPMPEWTSSGSVIFSGPPFFIILLAWVSRIGHAEVILRSIPWLAGTLSIPAMYFLSRQYISRDGALIAAFIISIAPSQIEFSQQLREYSLSVLVTIIFLISLTAFFKRPTWRATSILGAVVFIGIFSHYSLALLTLSINLVFLFQLVINDEARKDRIVKWSAIQLVALIAVLLVYLLTLRYQWEHWTNTSPESYLASGYWEPSTIKSGFSFAYKRTLDIISLAFPEYGFNLLIYIGILALILFQFRTINPFLFSAPFLIAIMAALLGLYPYFGARQNLYLTPVLYLIASFGIDYVLKFDKRRIVILIFLFMLLKKAVFVNQAYYKLDGNSSTGILVRQITTLAKSDEPIYICERSDWVVRYYFDVLNPELADFLVERDLGSDPRDYLNQVDELIEGNQVLWMLFDGTCGDVEPLIEHIERKYNYEMIDRRFYAQLILVHK